MNKGFKGCIKSNIAWTNNIISHHLDLGLYNSDNSRMESHGYFVYYYEDIRSIFLC